MFSSRLRVCRVFFGLCFFAATLPSCREGEAASDDSLLKKRRDGATLASSLGAPKDYRGPIDPQWPPSRAMDLEVELSASRLVLGQLEAGQGLQPQGKSLLTIDASTVRAEQGHIGGFDYIEVVLGVLSDPQESLPLVVLIHGRGGRPKIPAGPYLSERPIRLFIPRGPDKLEGGYNWLATWTNSGKIELLSRSLAGRVDQLMPAISAFAQLKPTLGKPMVVGFSQGGILAFALAMRYPSQFSAIFPIAGWLPPVLALGLGPVAGSSPFIHALHGGRDEVVPTKKGRQTVELFKRLGFGVEYTELDEVGHQVTAGMNQLVRTMVRTQTAEIRRSVQGSMRRKSR